MIGYNKSLNNHNSSAYKKYLILMEYIKGIIFSNDISIVKIVVQTYNYVKIGKIYRKRRICCV